MEEFLQSFIWELLHLQLWWEQYIRPDRILKYEELTQAGPVPQSEQIHGERTVSGRKELEMLTNPVIPQEAGARLTLQDPR